MIFDVYPPQIGSIKNRYIRLCGRDFLGLISCKTTQTASPSVAFKRDLWKDQFSGFWLKFKNIPKVTLK